MSKQPPEACLVILLYLEEPRNWGEKELQEAIMELINMVNVASDITGILTAGLYVDKWGEDPIISLFVEHDYRFGDQAKEDQMILDTFNKALELCDLEEDMWVIEKPERGLLDAES